MLEWVMRTAERVDAIAKHDPEYLELARQQIELAPKYESLLVRIAPEDRDPLLEYMDVTANMQYRISQLAWRYRTLHPHD